MPVVFYRRHTAGCEQHRPRHKLTYESDERRRGFKKCTCPIHVEGLLDRFGRRSTFQTTWDGARTAASAWISASSWDASRVAIVHAESAADNSDAIGHVLVEAAVKAFLAECEGRKLTRATVGKHRTLAKQIQAFSEERGFVWLKHWTVEVASEFRRSWKDGVRSAGKKLERMRQFFEFCMDRGWIQTNPAAKLKPPIGASRPANKTPFSDAELERIYEACASLPDQTWENGRASGIWTGEDCKTFVMFMAYTGLRISDAATFSIHRLSETGEIRVRAHKNGRWVSCWVPPELVQRLRAMPLVAGEFPFIGPNSARKETAADLWRRRLNRVFALCGEWTETPTPHRLRHCFARVLLQRGVPPADVAELMGITEAIVLKHYAAWVPERQARLTNVLKAAFKEVDRETPISTAG